MVTVLLLWQLFVSHVVFKVICNYSTFQGVINSCEYWEYWAHKAERSLNDPRLTVLLYEWNNIEIKRNTAHVFNKEEWPGALSLNYKSSPYSYSFWKKWLSYCTWILIWPWPNIMLVSRRSSTKWTVCGFRRRINKSSCSFTVLNIEHWLTPQNLEVLSISLMNWQLGNWGLAYAN